MKEVQVTGVYYKMKNAKNKVIVSRGGARSSKSHSVFQIYSEKFLSEKKKKFLILRKTLPSMKLSALKDMKAMWQDWGLTIGPDGDIREEKMNLDYYFQDNWVHFGALDDPEKIKSTEWNYILMEEANEFTYEDFKQLRLRMSAPSEDGKPNQMHLLLNPADEFHWIKTKVVDGMTGVLDIHSCYKDNPFLPQEYIDILLELKEQDPNQWAVYGLGEWGKLGNVIYEKWEVIDDDQFPEDPDETIYGLDFGFNAPSALVEIAINDLTDFYERELLYKTELTNSDLIAILEELIPEESRCDPIYCDCAEPDRIQEIKNAGFNAKPADKSVKSGIDFVKRHKTKITRSSTNLIKEKRGYSWKTDKDGRVYDDPVKFNDHCLDGERYAMYTHLGKRKEYNFRWAK